MGPDPNRDNFFISEIPFELTQRLASRLEAIQPSSGLKEDDRIPAFKTYLLPFYMFL